MAKQKRVILALDAETDPFEYGEVPEPFVWGLHDGENCAVFWGDKEIIKKRLIDELSEYPKGTIVYAHNGGKFDFHFLLDHLDADLMIVNGRIAKATILDGQIEFRDSYMLVPLPLATFGKIEIDYDKMRKENREKHKPEITRYLIRDCKVLWDVVTRFIERFGLNMSLAGTAIKELKKTGYDIPKTSQRYDDKFRVFYYGGRVQTFKTGSFKATDKPFVYADINSAYPKAMTENHWCGDQYFSTKELPDFNKLGPCLVTLEAITKGCLPYRGDDNKLYFPDDNETRVYNVTGWEILAGLKTDSLYIKKIIVCYRPLLTENFSTYINKWFAEKAAAKGVNFLDYQFAKLMQNSAYGKFGQDGRKFSKFCILPLGEWPEPVLDRNGDEIPMNDPEQWQFHSDTETGYTFFKRADPSDRFFNVSVAASITGWVRAYLWEHIHASKGVMYCDTDSIICEEFVGKISAELGDWEIEAELSEAHIAQRKMYACRVTPVTDIGPVNKTKIASKGVRLTYDEMKEGIETESIIEYERDEPSFSIRFGPRFVSRKIDLKNIEKNCTNNPTCITI